LRPAAEHSASLAADCGPKLTDRGFREAKARVIADFERNYVTELLARSHGNLSEAARVAGKERSRFGRLVKKYGLARETFAEGKSA